MSIEYAMAWAFPCAFLGGIGYIFTWHGMLTYNIDSYKKKGMPMVKSWKYMSILENMNAVLAFPITALVISNDYQKFVTMNMGISMFALVFYLVLSRPAKENRK